MPMVPAGKLNPVVSYLGVLITGFAAGLGTYQTSIQLTDRIVMSRSEFAAAVAGANGAPLKIEPKGVDTNSRGVCKDVKDNPVQVTERYLLKEDARPMEFIALEMEQDGFRVHGILKPGDGVMSATPTGWTIDFCSSPGWKGTNYRRFMNVLTGKTSALFPVNVDVPRE